jgi:alpha-beta hydrolase superfamily lysophospholipase
MLVESVRFGRYQLAGIFHSENPEASACVITCHGFLSSKDSSKYVAISEESCKKGFSALRFDFRGCGESEGLLRDTTLSKRILDLKSALDFVEDKSTHIFIMGSSLGGCVSILTAAQDSRIKGIATWATPAHFSEPKEKNHIHQAFFSDAKLFDIPKRIAKVFCPLLIIHGRQDKQVPFSHANILFRKANEPKLIRIIDNADHRFTNPILRTKAIELTLEWFMKHSG